MSLRDVGLRLVAMFPGLDAWARRAYRISPTFLQDTPTTKLRSLFSAAESVTFIQIGAFDGVSGDPIQPLVASDPRWSGVLVEPQPEMFERLKENYRLQADRLRFMQCAASDSEGEAKIFFIAPQDIARLGLEAWAGEVASFDRSHVLKHFPEGPVSEATVPVHTVSQIARLNDMPRADVIVMDVEGHERTLITSIDWDALQVKACIFEHKHIAADDLALIDGIFTSRGFALKRYGRDTVAHRVRGRP